MSEKFYLSIPLVPPSVNHYKTRFRNGNTVVSKSALAFKDAIALLIRGKFAQGKTFAVSMTITLGQGDRGDIDNYPKLVMDGLALAAAFRNRKGEALSDAHVTRMLVCLDRDERPEHGFTEVWVEAFA